MHIKETKAIGERMTCVECKSCGGPHVSNLCTVNAESNEAKAIAQGSIVPSSNHEPLVQTQVVGKVNCKRSLEELLESFINRSMNNFKNQEAAIKNLESQFGQLAKQLAELPQGKSFSDTIVNSNQKNASVVATRSGRVLRELEKKTEGGKSEKIVEEEVSVPIKNKVLNDPTPELSKIPFPKALVKKNLDKQFSKFVEVFKKLQINIPFSEALEKIPIYAKFMRDILSKKRKLSEVDETVMLTKECSAILQRKMPRKRRDPGSFTIPVEIEGLSKVDALCDLGASINLLPLSMFRRLNLGEVDKYVFPVDFVVLDMEEDAKILLILGRPFLATARAKIDVDKGQLILRVGKGKGMRAWILESEVCLRPPW
ncbi:uncharacterized protein LOC130712906 [Lotus japonicus]|uniref:uncharacterized protein LOC130712906 n=1 Tax=Lotus japonicus TaxID=34305 RepID=UPI002590D9A2|nr:uncharacterized protein LOC130712906 [Lotus japonicus]